MNSKILFSMTCSVPQHLDRQCTISSREACQEVFETRSGCSTWFFGSKYNGRKEGTTNAIPRHRIASATTHQAL